MAHIPAEKQLCFINQWGHHSEREDKLKIQLLNAIEYQIRKLSNQIYSSSRSECPSSTSDELAAKTLDQNDNSDEESSIQGSENDSEFTVQNCPESSYEKSLSGTEKVCRDTVSRDAKNSEDEKRPWEDKPYESMKHVARHAMLGEEQVTHTKDGEHSEITLPSYTEMCGDEDSLDQSLRDREVGEDTEDDDIVAWSDANDNTNVAMPGCFGDCMVGNQLPQDIRLPKASSLKNYRYIGKRRPKYEEFETTPDTEGNKSHREELRVPPADSTKHDVHLLVNRWLNDSDGKAATTERPDSKFSFYSDIKKACPDRQPRFSLSCIEFSSRDCRNRKRKLIGCENEAVTGSKSETDISRSQPRRPIKKRKMSSY